MYIPTPETLRPKINIDYPPHNNQIFEEFFYDYFIRNNFNTHRIYLPIFWTSLYVNRNYGQGDLTDIQKFLSTLDTSKKYFTIVQYDDGILNNISNLDCYIIAQTNGGKNTPKEYKYSYLIPLLCKSAPIIEHEKDIFCSYYCNFDIHPIREKLKTAVQNIPEYKIGHANYNEYSSIMQRSIFFLCPRGYSSSVFKICECLQRKTIPVYIYDIECIPFADKFNFNDICICIHENDIPNIDAILKSKSKEDINKMIDKGQEIYKEYYSYENCAKNIIKIINV